MDHPSQDNLPEKTPSARVQETRQRLLLAARQEFSTRGYAGCTTRAIAEAAGVSELTLFRHFATKKNLFLAAIDQFSAMPDLQNALAGKVTGDLQHDLNLIGTAFLRTLTARRAEILMTLREAEVQPELREVCATVPQMQQEMLAGYLRRQMEQGRLRRMDAPLAAQAFLGMLFAYAVRSYLGDPPQAESLEAVVSFFVDIFLKGATQMERKEL